MELFSEVYGCYYSVVAQILRQAHGIGLSRANIDRIVAENAFSESSFYLIPRLLGVEWDLLLERNGLHYSKLRHKDTTIPLTSLQKAWLKSLLRDHRIRLFLDDAQFDGLAELLSDIEPLFDPADFHIFDTAADGDNYTDTDYIRHFRMLLAAIKMQKPLPVRYESGKGGRMTLDFLPRKLLYSAKDEKFRAIGLHLTGKGSKPVLLNLARIRELDESDRLLPENPVKIAEPENRRTVQLVIFNERNALERCMLQFASYEKQTVYDESGERYLCDIVYDPMEETELLIRILSFGPVVKVLGPEPFLQQIRERVRLQMELIGRLKQ